MVTKRQTFRGSALADRLGTLNNFICNDADNLKWAPQFDVTEIDGAVEGVAENRFRVAEYISPLWSKVSIDYEKEALYDEHDAQIDVYGMDNLGLENLIYQKKLIDTEFGVPSNVQIDMLRSACTGAVTRLDSQETLDGYMKIKMPKLTESYDSVKVRSPWYDSAWSKRKGIPINGSPKRLHGELMYTDDQTGDAQFMVPESMTHEYWTFVIDVAYEAEMQADFGDLRFCGYDAVTPLEHWIISKTDSSTAKVMVRVPWYYGYKDIHPIAYGKTYGVDSSQAETCANVPEWATEPDFVWMYYGNASAADGSTVPTAGEKGVLYFNDFDGTLNDMETSGTNANCTITQTGTVLRMKIAANNTNTGIWWTKVIPEIEGKAIEVIWKLTDKPATAGNYDSTLAIGQRDALPVALDDYFGAWIDSTHVYTADVINSATASSWTTGGLSFDHDDVEPYYVKFRTHPTHESEAYMGVSIWLSRDCVEWTQYAHLIESADLTWNAQTQLKSIGMRLSAWATAPAFDMILDVDWVIVQEYHEAPHRGDQFRDSFIGSQFQYNWVGSGTGTGKTFALDTTNQQVDFTLSGVSARYDSGLNTAPIITAGVLGRHTSFIIETKVSAHARTTDGATRAVLSLGSDANKHFDVQHQLYNLETYDDEIRCVSTYGGVDYIKNEQQYRLSPIADGPVWLRIAGDQSTGQLWGMYSRDGYNWKTCGHDSLKSSYSDATNIRLLLANNGGGNATCSFDYIKVQTGPEVADNGRAITAAQTYGDWDEIDPLSTQYINYIDGFEDELITGRTWPYLDWVDISGKSTAIPYLWGTTAGAELLAENQSQFETGVSMTALNATITQSSTVAQSGTYSCKIVGTADDSAACPGGDHLAGTFRLGMAPGKFYELTGWHYTPNTECLEDEATGTQDARKGRPVLFYQDSGGTVRELHGEPITAINEWQFFRFRFYLVSSALSAAIRLYCGENGSTVYYDNLSLKEVQTPLTGNKSIRIGGGAANDYSGINLPMPYKTYSINFDWYPLYDNKRDGGPFFPLLRFKDAGDSQNYSEIGLYADGTTVELKVYSVSNRITSTESYGVVFRSTAANLPHKKYNVHIAVDEGRIRCWIDGVSKISGGFLYGTATGHANVFPSHYISIGSEIYHQAIWDNFQIRPGLWRIESDLTTWTQYAYQATPGPSLPSVLQPSFSSKWSDVYDQQDTYQFKFPTGYIRGQPLQVMWKDLGADQWQYSKAFKPGVKGVFEVGPNGLDKYIGMKTVVKFVGNEDHRFDIKNITYEYEV